MTLEDGRTIEAGEVIVAVDANSAAALLGSPTARSKAAVTSYFAAPAAPIDDALLVLDGSGEGPVNHVAVMSNVSQAYAPPGAHLVSVSGIGRAAEDLDAFAAAAPAQMRRWFGSAVDRWTHLKSYRIPHALPRHPAGSVALGGAGRRPDGLIVAGDYTEFGSIQGALRSGRHAADAVSAGPALRAVS